jgi:hypothetical protein
MKNVSLFAMHVLLAMGVSMLVGALMSVVIGTVLGRVGPEHWVVYRLTTDVPYSPLFWGSGLLLGFLVTKRKSNRSACWVWVAGAIWLGLGMLNAYSPLGSHPWYNPPWCPRGCSFLQQVWDDMFDVTGNKCGGSECLGELLFTAPFFCSIAYSVGAFLGLRSEGARLQTDS